MKIIQSFWSKPDRVDKGLSGDNRHSGGWNSPRYHFMSWALSCLRLLKFYKKVELFTDEEGKSLLIDRLNLPYTHVHTVLDNLDKSFSPSLWTLGKIYVYGLQNEPFLHVDSDVFIAERFEKRINKGLIVAQNLENNPEYYDPIVNGVLENLSLPDWLETELRGTNLVSVSNTGIVGGADNEFIRNYSRLALEILQKNRDRLTTINAGGFSVLIEQYLFLILAAREHKFIQYLFKESLSYKDDGILFQVHQSPHRVRYIHPLAGYKRTQAIERNLELTLRHEFPEQFFRIERVMSEF